MFAELSHHNTFIVQSVIYKITYILWSHDLVFKRHILINFGTSFDFVAQPTSVKAKYFSKYYEVTVFPCKYTVSVVQEVMSVIICW